MARNSLWNTNLPRLSRRLMLNLKGNRFMHTLQSYSLASLHTSLRIAKGADINCSQMHTHTHTWSKLGFYLTQKFFRSIHIRSNEHFDSRTIIHGSTATFWYFRIFTYKMKPDLAKIWHNRWSLHGNCAQPHGKCSQKIWVSSQQWEILESWTTVWKSKDTSHRKTRLVLVYHLWPRGFSSYL